MYEALEYIKWCVSFLLSSNGFLSWTTDVDKSTTLKFWNFKLKKPIFPFLQILKHLISSDSLHKRLVINPNWRIHLDQNYISDFFYTILARCFADTTIVTATRNLEIEAIVDSLQPFSLQQYVLVSQTSVNGFEKKTKNMRVLLPLQQFADKRMIRFRRMIICRKSFSISEKSLKSRVER